MAHQYMTAPGVGKRYWISYDIASDQRRGHAHRVLSGYGVRVQFSAFECVLTDMELRSLLRALDRVLEAAEDHLVVYQCAALGKPTHPCLGRSHDRRQDFWVR